MSRPGEGRNAQADWKGKPRTDETHASRSDSNARLFRRSHNRPPKNTAQILTSGRPWRAPS
jgi:hypothetical protein